MVVNALKKTAHFLKLQITNWDSTLCKAIRTFGEAFAAYLLANLRQFQETESLSALLPMYMTAAAVSGIAAVITLIVNGFNKEGENEDENE